MSSKQIIVSATLVAALGACTVTSSGGGHALKDNAGNRVNRSNSGSTGNTKGKSSPTSPKPLPAPRHYSGRGDDVIHVKIPGNGPATLTATYNGNDNFIVDAHGSGQDDAGGDNLINTIGHYHGTTALDFGDGKTTSLAIQAAGGSWTMTIADALSAPRFSASARGHGDDVLIYTGSASIFKLTNTNSSDNFIVDEYTNDNGDDNIVNEIGHYSGKVEGDTGPGFVVIQSTGDWTARAIS